jgi:2-methylcitrate dehydratase
MSTDQHVAALARYSAELRYADLPATVVHETKRKLIDAIGCALGAYSDEPCVIARKLAQSARGEPPARVLGSLDASTPELAAFANGTMVRAQDFNDSYLAGSSCHPSDTIPAVLAAAESAHADGQRLITATVAAYEADCNFADVMTREQGWDNVFFDTVGSALGSAHAFGLDADRTAHALALAITSNLALAQTRLGELSMWKGCAAANAARNGVFAAMLARAGITGPQNTIEGRWGLQRVLGAFEWAPFGGQGGPWRIAETHLKFYPAVVHAQSPVAVALKLFGCVATTEIKTITIDSYWVARRYSDNERAASLWNPQTRETADHSIVWLVAAVLLDGGLTAESFKPQRINDPALRALMQKIVIRENPEFSAAYPARWPCRIEIESQNGARHSEAVEYFKGHCLNPLSDAEVETKFRTLTSDVLDAKRAGLLLDKLWHLDTIANIGEIIDATAINNQFRAAH